MIRNKLIRGALACAIVAASAWGAIALNVDQNRVMPARQNVTQQTNYYRLKINFNDPNISQPQKFGKFLQNTFISSVSCHVTTAFNAATTNILTIGTNPTTTGEIVAVGGANKTINLSSATYQSVTAAGSLGLSTTSDADHTLYAAYSQTGTAATAGAATCIIEFVPNNDM